jgi:hypothetical protein
MGELYGIAIKIPLWEKGIEGDLRTGNWKEFLANAITPIPGGPEPAGRDRQLSPQTGKALTFWLKFIKYTC